MTNIYELKNTDFYQNVSNHYPTKVVKIQLVLGTSQDYSPGTPGRRQRVRLRALAGAKGPAECLQPFVFYNLFLKKYNVIMTSRIDLAALLV